MSNGNPATPLLVLFFLATRFLLFANFQLGSEIERAYSKPALEIEQATHHGVSFYDYHQQHIQKRIDRARREGKTPLTEEMKKVEYPPLSILVMYLPILFTGEATEDELDNPGAATARYVLAYRIEMALVDGFCFVLLAFLIPRLFPEETSAASQERLVIYILAGAVLGHLLYDRLDLVLGGLILLSAALLMSRVHYFWSFLVLAVAVNFKLIPIVLFPVWVLVSLRPSVHRLGRLVMVGAGRSLLLIGLTLAVMVPFLLLYGDRCLEFLSFHQHRGLEVESIPSSLLIGLAGFGYPAQLTWGFGAFEMTGPGASALGLLFTVLMAVLLLIGSALLGIGILRGGFSPLPRSSGGEGGEGGERDPRLILLFALLFLMTALAASKVFSPQFLLFLLPLVPLAPLPKPARRWFLWGFVAVAVLTTLIFPYFYLFVRLRYPNDQYPIPPLTGSLAVTGGVLLIVRNTLFVLLTAVLWHQALLALKPTGERGA